jgi:hypothetical protein
MEFGSFGRMTNRGKEMELVKKIIILKMDLFILNPLFGQGLAWTADSDWFFTAFFFQFKLLLFHSTI